MLVTNSLHQNLKSVAPRNSEPARTTETSDIPVDSVASASTENVEAVQQERLQRAKQIVADPSAFEPHPVEPQAKGFLQSTLRSALQVAGSLFSGPSSLVPALISEDKALEMCEQEVEFYADAYGISEDPKANERLQSAVMRANESLPGRSFQGEMLVLDTQETEGMIKGNTILMSKGLIERSTDEELLFVAAHEVGHYKRDHNRLRHSFAHNIALETSDSGKLSRKGKALQNGMDQFFQRAEKEADIDGFTVLKNEGIDRSHAVSWFLQSEISGDGKLDGQSDTHPSDASRIWEAVTF